MQHQSVSLYHLHSSPTFLDSVSVVQWHCAEVGEKEDIRGYAPNLKCIRYTRVVYCSSLRPDPHSYTKFLCCSCQIAVDALCLLDAPGHWRQEQGSAQGLTEEDSREVDAGSIDIRERLMNEAEILKACG